MWTSFLGALVAMSTASAQDANYPEWEYETRAIPQEITRPKNTVTKEELETPPPIERPVFSETMKAGFVSVVQWEDGSRLPRTYEDFREEIDEKGLRVSFVSSAETSSQLTSEDSIVLFKGPGIESEAESLFAIKFYQNGVSRVIREGTNMVPLVGVWFEMDGMRNGLGVLPPHSQLLRTLRRARGGKEVPWVGFIFREKDKRTQFGLDSSCEFGCIDYWKSSAVKVVDFKNKRVLSTRKLLKESGWGSLR